MRMCGYGGDELIVIIQVVVAAAAGGACVLVGDLRIACCILAVGIFMELVISLWSDRMKRKRLEELTMYLMQVQDEPEVPELAKHNEGQIGILQSEIYKLVVLLKEQSAGAVKEKEYLAKMLSDISHQIKTPLTSITILTELLENPDLSEEKRLEFTGKIDSQVNRITWLIRNLLTLSQLDANMLKLKREEVNLRELLDKACQPFEIMAELKGIALKVSAPAEVTLICDEHWMAEAISNIVKNCVEHTDEGGEVSVRAEQNNFATNIRIKDNGSGIAKEHLPHIFERFYKGDNPSKESIGIGLAMSKQVIMRQNGIIDVKSEKGVGTEFSVKIYRGVA